MRAFYLAWPLQGTVSVKSPSSPATARAGGIVQTLSAQFLGALAKECAARFHQDRRPVAEDHWKPGMMRAERSARDGMKIRAYPVLCRAVEEGVAYGKPAQSAFSV